jgi:hypothetical protein
MTTQQPFTPELEAMQAHSLAFAKAWMARKRADQKEMRETAMQDPAMIAALAELDRRAAERGGSYVVEL